MYFDLIVCTDNEHGFAKNGKIPWKIKEDTKFYQQKISTTCLPNLNNILIMGRITAEDIKKPLPNRYNFIISRTLESKINSSIEEYSYFNSLNNCLYYCSTLKKIDKIFVIGGELLYKEAMVHPFLQNIYYTCINHNYACDRTCYVPSEYELKASTTINCLDELLKKQVDVEFRHYVKPRHPELDYLEIMKKITTTGHYRETRNAKTYSLFGKQIKFNLKNGTFPLLTTKKVTLRLIFEELMFFLRGQTDVGILQNKNIHIWDGNTNAEFIEKLGFRYEYGDKTGLPYDINEMGPMYGIQFRAFGAKYKGKDYNHIGEGLDQLTDVINLLKSDPHSRRILMTSFNPIDAKKGVLYPCHSLILQFYVDHEKYLSCSVYNRSQDFFLGNPFNIASHALMVYIMCELVNNSEDYKGQKLEPGELIIGMGDVHIYSDHIEAVKLQLDRIPYEFPKLKFKRKINNANDIEWDDVILENYESHDSIKAKMIA